MIERMSEVWEKKVHVRDLQENSVKFERLIWTTVCISDI